MSEELKVRVGKARASYAHVFVPTSIEDEGKKTYGLNLIVPKDNTEMIKQIKAAIHNAFEVGKQTLWNGKVPGNAFNPLIDGDNKHPDDEAYANSYFLNAKSETKPGVNKVKGYKTVDGKRTLQIEEITDEEEFYSGCYVYATVKFFPFSKGPKGVGCRLCNVLKVEDGEVLGTGNSTPEQDFNDLDLPEEDLPYSPDNDPFGATAEDECPY